MDVCARTDRNSKIGLSLRRKGLGINRFNEIEMFTGIVEAQGELVSIQREAGNIHLDIRSPISSALKVDQSVAHDGVCLTVVSVKDEGHRVTAIEETLRWTALGGWELGRKVNLERAMQVGARLDGHLVQGHVDDVGICQAVEPQDGSWLFTFSFDRRHAALLVHKGSICINGVSLTVIAPEKDRFQVAIIPYTYEHTNFGHLQPGEKVNLEFDLIGKYWLRARELGLGS